jgi:hypothetical protein
MKSRSFDSDARPFGRVLAQDDISVEGPSTVTERHSIRLTASGEVLVSQVDFDNRCFCSVDVLLARE